MNTNLYRTIIKARLGSGEKAWQVARDLDISTALVNYYNRTPSSQNRATREQRKEIVLSMLAQGNSLSIIASNVGIDETTLSGDMNYYRAEYGVKTNKELLKMWGQNGEQNTTASTYL